jgi:ribose transport system ATP-binding protein
MQQKEPGAANRTASTLALEIVDLSKTFGGERALQKASLSINEGEVHGLLGQNGSGKSTLIKILAGFHEPDPGGKLKIYSKPVSLPLAPGEFRRYGISFVHQNLGLVSPLSVVENLFIGELASHARWMISWSAERERAAKLFKRYGLDIDPSATVGKLLPVQRALLAIVRAVEEMRIGAESNGRGLLVLDEPTPFLPKQDVDKLFALVRSVVKQGASVIFVSHDVDEVLEITDRATVLRDGKVAGTLVTAQSSKQDFIEMIIGRRLESLPARPTDFGQKKGNVEIQGLSGGTLNDVNIELHSGEIVGLTGLMGSGFDEVPYLLFGANPAQKGLLRLGERRYAVTDMTPAKAMAAKMVLIPADRPHAGAIGALSMADNMTMPVLHTAFRSWMLNRRALLARTQTLAQRFDVTPNAPSLPLTALSGGNQQKVILAKWLQMEPLLIILDEPTQGVDVGARQKVFKAIEEATDTGAAVLCASSDYEQLEAICDRVLIFSRGRVVAELVGAAITKDNIAERCYASMPGGNG